MGTKVKEAKEACKETKRKAAQEGNHKNKNRYSVETFHPRLSLHTAGHPKIVGKERKKKLERKVAHQKRKAWERKKKAREKKYKLSKAKLAKRFAKKKVHTTGKYKRSAERGIKRDKTAHRSTVSDKLDFKEVAKKNRAAKIKEKKARANYAEKSVKAKHYQGKAVKTTRLLRSYQARVRAARAKPIA